MNIESIKKIAEREGLSLNKLIKHFKEGETFFFLFLTVCK